MFDVKLRENALIKTLNGQLIRRNIYSHYVSNANPVYCRFQGSTWFISDTYEIVGSERLYQITRKYR